MHGRIFILQKLVVAVVILLTACSNISSTEEADSSSSIISPKVSAETGLLYITLEKVTGDPNWGPGDLDDPQVRSLYAVHEYNIMLFSETGERKLMSTIHSNGSADFSYIDYRVFILGPSSLQVYDLKTKETKMVTDLPWVGLYSNYVFEGIDTVNTSLVYSHQGGEGGSSTDERFALNYLTNEIHQIYSNNCLEGECEEKILDPKIRRDFSLPAIPSVCGSILITAAPDDVSTVAYKPGQFLEIKVSGEKERISKSHFLGCIQ